MIMSGIALHHQRHSKAAFPRRREARPEVQESATRIASKPLRLGCRLLLVNDAQLQAFKTLLSYYEHEVP